MMKLLVEKSAAAKAMVDKLEDKLNLKEIWQAVLGDLEVSLSKANFTTWFKDTKLVSVENNIAILAVPNTFTKEWLQKKYQEQILKTLQKFQKEIKEIKYKVTPTTLPPIVEKAFDLWKQQQKPTVPTTTISNLNPKYNFGNFIVGNSNRLAAATSQAVAEKPGKLHNPLFIYGGVGLGKTHLIQAIGNEILAKGKSKKVIYVSCEKFTNDFVSALQTKNMGKFKKNYREIDVLLVDDIQFISNKEGIQEEFFHTFNDLHQTNRQIVMTSDRPPKAIPALEERLSSRFGWGMIADIAPPNYETRLAILKAKCQEKSCGLNLDIVDYIASNIRTNIRDLESALNRVITYCQLNEILPSLEITQKVLENVITYGKGNINLEKILKVVCEFFNIKSEELLGKKRNKELVYPRQITMYLLRHELSFSYPKIGQELGGKDHTTIMHGCSKIENEISRNSLLKEELSLLKEKLYSF